MGERGFSSPWTWIGCGCGALLLVAMSVVGAIVFVGWRTARSIQTGFQDPEGRQAAVERVLHPHSLPEGYHPVGGLHIPLMLDLAILSDRPPQVEKDQELGERAFIFLEVAGFLHRGEDDWDEDLGFLDSGNIRVKRGDLIRRGEIALPDVAVSYAAFRGEVNLDDRRRDGLFSLLYLRCNEPADDHHRFGIWIGPDPQPGAPVEELDLTGTPADEEAVRDLLGHFSPCI